MVVPSSDCFLLDHQNYWAKKAWAFGNTMMLVGSLVAFYYIDEGINKQLEKHKYLLVPSATPCLALRRLPPYY
jgi:hypothetical protein